jgi:uroporphyrinogen decarboxylase
MATEYLTTYERYKRMFEHKEADRIPIFDIPWESTIERWHREGMPKNVSYIDFFGLDHLIDIILGTAPFQEHEILEETDEYKIYKNTWGTVFKQWKHKASTPEYLEFKIVNPDEWNKAKIQLTPHKDHINWKRLKDNYKSWRENGYWIQAHFWFGFDITHSWIIGTERMLIALIENPEWCMDMFQSLLNYNLALFQMMWDEGYKFDSIYWADDMGYKFNQFFSLKMYHDILKPFHQQAIDWAHEKGIKAHMHSCGDVNPFVPELIKMGLDALNPLEVKAGMNPIQLKKDVGQDIVLHGGINAVLWDKPEQIKAEMEKVIPTLKENGGYIFSSDHTVPSSVSIKDFETIIKLAKELGTY